MKLFDTIKVEENIPYGPKAGVYKTRSLVSLLDHYHLRKEVLHLVLNGMLWRTNQSGTIVMKSCRRGSKEIWICRLAKGNLLSVKQRT